LFLIENKFHFSKTETIRQRKTSPLAASCRAGATSGCCVSSNPDQQGSKKRPAIKNGQFPGRLRITY
jgi:hypothetical protein